MNEWIERFMWLGVGPLVTILLLEHLLLTRVYKKQSSLQRLTRNLNRNGFTDLVMWSSLRLPFKYVPTILRVITIPGATWTAMVWLDKYVTWPGVLGDELFDAYILNFLLYYVIYDFAHYWAHYALHRVPALWEFHKLHHSATEMNIITGVRVSLAERGFLALVSFGLLTVVCGLPSPGTALGLIITRQVVEFLQHSDLPWDYGPLGYVVAGPRFHRMHHSDAEADYDSNFGDLFSFWDRIFGTVSHRYVEEGSSSSDSVGLGLGQEDENRRYSNWFYAVFHQTIPHYGYLAVRGLYRRATGKQVQAAETQSPAGP